MLRLLAFALLAVLLPRPAHADWPQFRGPAGNGTTTETDLPLAWSPEQGVLWKTELPGAGASSPIITHGKVFLAAYSGYGPNVDRPGEMSQLKRHAVCLDAASGKLLWSREVPAELPETKFAGPYITLHGFASATPATDGTLVYFSFGRSGVAAYTLDGQQKWHVQVGEKAHDWGSGASPVVFGDLLFVNAGIESDTLLALNKQTGETVWSAAGMPRAWNTPQLAPAPDGGRQLLISVRGKIRGFDPRTGTERWSCRGIGAAELCPSIVTHDQVAYILGSPGGQAMAVKTDGTGDVSQSHLLWQIRKGSNVVSPVYHAGHLYWAHDRNGIVYCADAKTGELKNETRLEPRAGRIYASPILSGDRLYYVSRTAGTYVVAAAPEFKLLAHNPLGARDEVFNASPAVDDGKLYLRSDRYLYCIGKL